MMDAPASTWQDEASQYIRVGARVISLRRDESCTWSDKSRWPTSKSISRTASLLREDWDDCSATQGLLFALGDKTYTHADIIERSIGYEARGNWLICVVADLLKIEAAQERKELRAVQLNPHCRIERVRNICGVAIYRRTLAGEHLDWCAVARGTTCHADTQRLAISGLIPKLVSAGDRREVLDMAYARALGFCRTGIRFSWWIELLRCIPASPSGGTRT